MLEYISAFHRKILIFLLGQEKHMLDRYIIEMKTVSSLIRKKLIWRGLVNSIAQSVPLFGDTVAICYGAFLVADGEIHFKNVIKCVAFR